MKTQNAQNIKRRNFSAKDKDVLYKFTTIGTFCFGAYTILVIALTYYQQNPFLTNNFAQILKPLQKRENPNKKKLALG